MFAAKSWFHASLHAGRRWLRPEHAPGTPSATPPGPAALVPIRTLTAAHRERVRAHLLALVAADRIQRFGYRASDEQIGLYVNRLDFVRDEVFGIFNRRLELIAMAHLASAVHGLVPTAGGSAELGLSVLPRARGKGYGGRLFARAALHAGNAGIGRLVIQALGRNAAMLRIARKAGATVRCSGGEAEAWLPLPSATLDSRLRQWREVRLGETDYRLKRDSRRFWAWIACFQEVRHGVRQGRSSTGR